MNALSSPIKYYLYARKSSEGEDKQVESVPSQVKELTQLAKERGLEIVDILTEEKSAKRPGRPVFNKMLADINSGKANGILCWKLDRLARNPRDGGDLQMMLQDGVIQHIQTFQQGYTPNDNVMVMCLEFGIANQFIRDLSLNTKRGQRAKAEKGWLPHKPPIGYRNNQDPNSDLPPIYSDPILFPAIKKLWKTLIEERCSVEDLYERAFELGLRRKSGKAFGRSSFYRTLRNPFYYGEFDWQEKRYKGAHEPMISKEDFDLAQDIIDGRVKQLTKRDGFTFRGFLRCGECGASITSEHRIKKQKNGNVHHYTYYHCTKRIKRDCSQRLIRSDELDTQVLDVLDKISIPLTFHQWAIKQLQMEAENEKDLPKNNQDLGAKNLEAIKKKLDSLLTLRMNGEITAEEYSAKKDEITTEKSRLELTLKNIDDSNNKWIEKAEKVFNIAAFAKKKFQAGSWEVKKNVIADLSSNLTLQDKILNIPVDNRLALLFRLTPSVRNLHKRFEPRYPIENTASWDKIYDQNIKWGLLKDVRRNLNPTEPDIIQLVTTFHRKRYGRLMFSLDLPLPQLPNKHPLPPTNIVQEALRVKAYMDANPDETCLSAAGKLNIHRKRISKLLSIANNLQPNLIMKLVNCNDPKILRQMNVRHLLSLTK